MPNKQQRLAYDAKAKEILAKMTQNEKIDLLAGKMGLKESIQMFGGKGYNYIPWGPRPNKRVGAPAMQFCDGPRGVVSGTSTCFPVTMARGASFDPELEERVGEVIGKEIRALGGNYFGGVCINLPYNPGWGRSQEVYGEDSMHMGKMAVALTTGVQKHNVVACLKHYAFNSMECKRFSVSVEADKRTEREIYLRHFKQCIDAGAASVMGAYNKYQGKHCCHNDYLIRDVLKKEWDFDGFVISDFVWGVRDTVEAMNGGCDVEMCMTNKYSRANIKKALKKGQITQEQIDDAVLRQVRTLLAFSEAEDPQDYPASLNQCAEHVALAKEVAEKSMTLLKNDGVLPFSKDVKNIVIVGDLAKDGNTGDHGSSWIMRANADNTYDALTKRFGKVTYVANKDIDKNKAAIEKADAVIAVVGLRHSDEGEFVSEKTNIGGDRKGSLGLHDDEIAIINKLGEWNKEKSAIVLIGGNTLILDPWFENVSAVLMAYYPGMRGGETIVNTLFGDVNPSGKTPYVTPFSQDDLPKIDWDAEVQRYEYYHGYRKLDKEGKAVRLPYGFGLSYTSFELSDIKLASVDEKKAVFSVTVTNTGAVKGGEVAQVYVGFNGSAVDRPVKSLMDFGKVYLEAGESKVVELTVNKSDLAYFDEGKNAFVEEDIDYTAYIGNCADSEKLTAVEFRFA